MLNEATLIERLIQSHFPQRQDVLLGIGDDCALLSVPTGKQLAVTMDSLIAGTHFPEQTTPFDIGYKAVAVNLSDLAAMGAEPAWITISLSTPELEETWVTNLLHGLVSLAKQHGVTLIGGDTCRGPLMLTLQAHGFVDDKKALCRHQAQAGDAIYVTGTLGDAAVGLATIQNTLNHTLEHPGIVFCQQRLNQPTPRVAIGQALVDVAHAMIDLSDGLQRDLGHILKRSDVGATIYMDHLPLSPALCALPQDTAWQYALCGGDDYELCFTAPREKHDMIMAIATEHKIDITQIGEIMENPGELRLTSRAGVIPTFPQGFQHF